MATRVLVPSGVLGLGFSLEALQRGVEAKPDIICIDGGSTDSGPFSLGSSTSKYSRAVCKSEWRELMLARKAANVPLVISSCGTCGTDDMVQWMLDITTELAEELGHSVLVSTIFSEQKATLIQLKIRNGQCHALEPSEPLDVQTVNECEHIVALAGVEQVARALDIGSDIVLLGRATDTAAICALPIARGEHVGAAWHGAKIAECGAFCSTHPGTGVIMLEVDETGFSVRPMAVEARCTPHSVSAHMLYENADPIVLKEPGGSLNVSSAVYEAIDESAVRVTGSQWIKSDTYTVKLEGARKVGYQSTIMAILRERRYVENAAQWISRLSGFLEAEIESKLEMPTEYYDLEFRLIGVDSALGQLERRTSNAVEVGVLGIITAPTAFACEEIGKLINPFVLHYPLTDDEPMPTFAFPFSPAQSERGPVYEFCLNHIIELDDPMSAFRLEVQQLGPRSNA